MSSRKETTLLLFFNMITHNDLSIKTRALDASDSGNSNNVTNSSEDYGRSSTEMSYLESKI